MFRRLFWLSTVAGIGYMGYRFWRWVQQQNQPSAFLNDALAGRLYDQPAAPAPHANTAEAPAPTRRIVTRVHKGAPPAAPAAPAAEPSAAPTGEGLTFGPEIVGAAAPAADLADMVSPAASGEPVDLAPLVSAEAEAGAPILGGPLTNINSADEDALVALPGIGRALARRIIAHRDENGPFASIDALEAIQGIGPRNIDEFRHLVTV